MYYLQVMLLVSLIIIQKFIILLEYIISDQILFHTNLLTLLLYVCNIYSLFYYLLIVQHVVHYLPNKLFAFNISKIKQSKISKKTKI